MKVRESCVVLAVILAAGLSSGCQLLLLGAGAAAGAGTVAYLQGELKTNLDAPLANALKASEDALKETGHSIIERTEGTGKGKLVARGAGDKRVEVNLRVLTPKATEIGIRVGTFGDEALSRQLLEKIQKRL